MNKTKTLRAVTTNPSRREPRGTPFESLLAAVPAHRVVDTEPIPDSISVERSGDGHIVLNTTAPHYLKPSAARKLAYAILLATSDSEG